MVYKIKNKGVKKVGFEKRVWLGGVKGEVSGVKLVDKRLL